MEILQEKLLLFMFPFSIHFHGDSLLVGVKGQIYLKYAWELEVLSGPEQHGSKIDDVNNSHADKVSFVCIHIKVFRAIFTYAHKFFF